MKKMEEQELSFQGIRFCPTCKNILIPFKANGNILEFQCKNCRKRDVDFTDKVGDQCLLYSKEIRTAVETEIVDKDFALDPAMPRIDVECENCNYPQAVYCLQPDAGQRKIRVVLVCGRVEKNKAICGHKWEMDEDTEIRL